MTWNVVRTLFATGLGLSVTACDPGGDTSLGSEFQLWKQSDNALKKYPNMDPFQARKRHGQDLFDEAVAKAETEDEKKWLAAQFFLGFSLLNGRAIPDYCQEMKLDILQFAIQFDAANEKENKAASAILKARGTNRMEIYDKHAKYFRSAAKNELLAAGSHNGTYALCKRIGDNPGQFLGQAKFQYHFPTISRVLTDG